MDKDIIVNVVEKDKNGIPCHTTLAYKDPKRGPYFSFTPSEYRPPEVSPRPALSRVGNGKATANRRCGPWVPDHVFEAIREKATEVLRQS